MRPSPLHFIFLTEPSPSSSSSTHRTRPDHHHPHLHLRLAPSSFLFRCCSSVQSDLQLPLLKFILLLLFGLCAPFSGELRTTIGRLSCQMSPASLPPPFSVARNVICFAGIVSSRRTVISPRRISVSSGNERGTISKLKACTFIFLSQF